MARVPEGKSLAQKGKMSADYGQRAALALDFCIPGPHRDKSVARLLGVSVRMAKYLRAGQFWTTDRLSQASTLLGAAFDAALLGDVQRHSNMEELTERLARLEAWREEVDRPLHVGPVPPEGGSADDKSSARTRESSEVARPVRGRTVK